MNYGYPIELSVSDSPLDTSFQWKGNMKSVINSLSKWLDYYHRANVLHTDSRLPNMLVFRTHNTISKISNSMKSTHLSPSTLLETNQSKETTGLDIQVIDFDLSSFMEENTDSATIYLAPGNRLELIREIAEIDYESSAKWTPQLDNEMMQHVISGLFHSKNTKLK